MSDSKQIAAALSAPFAPEDLKQRPGRGGMTFTYADARAVAQRLDDTLGIEGWQFEVTVAEGARSVVKGSLAVVIGGKTVVREDFGYPNSAQDEEPLKSAASDALRRCAAQLGVGRSLYGSAEARQGIRTAPATETRPSVAENSLPEASGDERLARAALAFVQGSTDGACSHGTEWTLKPAGVSKVGKPYAAFWTASHRLSDGSYCREKPSIKWLAAHPTTPAHEPAKDDLSDMPF